MYKDLTDIQKSFYDGYDKGYEEGLKAKNTSDNSDYTKSKTCANCDKLYKCSDVRKHPEWHCKKHDFA